MVTVFGKKISITMILLVSLFLLGVFLRLSGTLKGYFAFTFDQGKDFLAFKELVYDRQIHLTGPTAGIDGVFHGVWWYWLMAPFFALVSGNPLQMVVIFGILMSFTILLAYYLGATLFNKTLGLTLAALVTFSQFFIGIATQIWHPNVEPMLILLLLLLSWKVLQKESKLLYFLIGITCGLVFEFELLSGGLFLAGYGVAFLVFKRIKAQTLLLLIGFLTILAPRIFFDVRNDFIQTRSFIKYISTSSAASAKLPLGESVVGRAGQFFTLFSEAFAGGNTILAAALLCILIGSSFSIIFKTKSEQLKKFVQFLWLIGIVFFVVAALYPGNLWNYYLIGLPSLMLPLVGVCFLTILKLQKQVGIIVITALLATQVYNLNLPGIFREPPEGDHSLYRNQMTVVETAFTEAQGEQFNVQVYTSSVIDYGYHYLFWWYGKTYIDYSPDRDTIHPLVFLIVEPDKWNPVLKEAWLRDREGDGTIIWHKTFRGGIEVEKRIR